MTASAETPTYPMEMKISETIRARLGFSDGRVEIGIKKAFLPAVWLTISEDEISTAREVLERAEKWRSLPQEERERLGGNESCGE